MKMTKKIFGAAAAVAMVLGFASCDWSLSDVFQSKFGDTSMITYDDTDSDALGKWFVKGENKNTEDYKRGLQFLSTKHSDLSGIIDIDTNDIGLAGPGGNSGGVIGLVIDGTKIKGDKETETPDKYNFLVIGVRCKDDQPGYYISYFANITEDSFKAFNMGATTTVSETDPYEIENKIAYQTLPKAYRNKETGIMTVVIDVKEDSETGDYKISFYSESDLKDRNAGLKTDAIPFDTVTVEASKIGKEGPAQAKVGVYAGVYKGNGDDKDPVKLDGALSIMDFTNAANVAE